MCVGFCRQPSIATTSTDAAQQNVPVFTEAMMVSAREFLYRLKKQLQIFNLIDFILNDDRVNMFDCPVFQTFDPFPLTKLWKHINSCSVV